MPTKTLFGEQLKFLRNKKGVKQESLIRRRGHTKGKPTVFGCSLQTVSNWECGRFLPKHHQLGKILTRENIYKLREPEIRSLAAAYQYDLVTRKLLTQFKLETPWFMLRVPITDSASDGWLNPILKTPKLGTFNYIQKPRELGDSIVGCFWNRDEAMRPTYKAGDFLFFDLAFMRPKRGETYIIGIADKVYCRELSKTIGTEYHFKKLYPKPESMVVDIKKINWLYKVILKKRRSGSWPKLTQKPDIANPYALIL